MARLFLTAIDLSKNELLNARIQNLGSAPSAPVTGQVYYDTTDSCLKFFNGTTWVCTSSLITSVSGTAPIVASVSGGVLTISINPATTSAAGSMSAADKTKLDSATASATASTLVLRDGSGNASFADPTAGNHAATKNYVDSVAQGLVIKDSVRAATTANVTLSGAQTIDGVSVVAGDRVLVKNQTTASQNGIYIAAAGAWSRASDMDTWAEVPSAFVFVEEGTTLADTGWVCQSDAGGTINTTSITWTQFGAATSYTAGAGLTQSGNVFDVVAGDGSLTVSSDSVVVKRKTSGGIGVDTNGIFVENYTPVDSTTVARKYTTTDTLGSGTTKTITHNLGTQAVTAQVFLVSSNERIECDMVANASNTIQLTAYGADVSCRIVVIG